MDPRVGARANKKWGRRQDYDRAPIIPSSLKLRSDPLDDRGNALADADAHGAQRVAPAGAFQLV